MISLSVNDMIVTDVYDGQVVEVCIFEGVEGYLMLDVTPNRIKIKHRMERYVKKVDSLPYSQRIRTAEYVDEVLARAKQENTRG